MKKFLSVLLASCLILTMIVSCSETPAPASSDAPDSSSVAPTEDSSEDTAGSESGLWFEETLTVEWMVPENVSTLVKSDSLVIQTMKERWNVELVPMPTPESDYQTKFLTMASTNRLPEITYTQYDALAEFGSQGLFVNLYEHEDILPNYMSLITTGDRAIESKKSTVDGALYGFQHLSINHGENGGPRLTVRYDLMEDSNIAMPNSFDEFYDAMLTIKEADPSRYAFSTRFGTKYLLGQWAYPMGSGGFTGFSENGLYYEPNDDAYVYGPADERFKAVVEYMANAYADDLLSPDYATMSRDITWEKLSTDQLYVFHDNSGFIYGFNETLQTEDPDAFFGFVPALENAQGEKRGYHYEIDRGEFASINPESERLEDVLKFVDYLYSKEGSVLTNYGVEGETYEVVDGQEMILQSIIDTYINAEDFNAAINGEYGLGRFNFALFDDSYLGQQKAAIQEAEMDPAKLEQKRADEQINREGDEAGYYSFMSAFPPLTTEQVEKVVDLNTAVDTVFTSGIDHFIIGERPMSEYDDFIAEMEAAGVRELEAVYNEAYEAIK